MRLLLAHPLVLGWLSEADQLPHIWLDDYLGPEAQAGECPFPAGGASG